MFKLLQSLGAYYDHLLLQRDVMVDINPEGKYNEEKIVEKQLYEKPEKRDVMADINPEGK